MMFFLISTLWASEGSLCSKQEFTKEESWIELVDFEKKSCTDKDVPVNMQIFTNQFRASFKKLESEHKDDLLEIGSKLNSFHDPNKLVYSFGDDVKRKRMSEYQKSLKEHVQKNESLALSKEEMLRGYSNKLKIGVFVFTGLFLTSFIGILGLLIKRDNDDDKKIEKINDAAQSGAGLLAKQIHLLQAQGSVPSKKQVEELHKAKRSLEKQDKKNKGLEERKNQLEQSNKDLTQQIRTLQKKQSNRRVQHETQSQSHASLEEHNFSPEQTDPRILTDANKRTIVTNLIKLATICPKTDVKGHIKYFKQLLGTLKKNLNSRNSIQKTDINNPYIFFLHWIFRRDPDWFSKHIEAIKMVNESFKDFGLIDANPTAIFEGEITKNSDGEYLLENNIIVSSHEDYLDIADDMSEIRKFKLLTIYWKVYGNHLQLQKLSSSSNWTIKFK